MSHRHDWACLHLLLIHVVIIHASVHRPTMKMVLQLQLRSLTLFAQDLDLLQLSVL